MAAPTRPLSLLEQPPTQAAIDTQGNLLTIRADNASLTQTLQRIARQTGMHLDGINGDQRVFGTFGPGAPRDVLYALLTGTGYNVLMLGALGNGAPRQLILSQDKASATPAPAPVEQEPAAPADDDTSDAPPDDIPPPPQQFVPPSRGGDTTGNIRTPQQMLQQLQELRQQQQQQQGPQ